MDDIITSVVASIIVAAIVGMCGWLASQLKTAQAQHAQDEARQKARQEVVDGALRALLYDKLARLHSQTVAKGLPASVEVKERADVAWKAYRALDPDGTLSDGTAAHLHEEIIDAHVASEE